MDDCAVKLSIDLSIDEICSLVKAMSKSDRAKLYAKLGIKSGFLKNIVFGSN